MDELNAPDFPHRASATRLTPCVARRLAGHVAVLGVLTLFTACSVYRPLPLRAPTGDRVLALTVPASTLLPGGLQTHPFDPTDGLDATEVAMLALARSPALKVLRANAKVTRAQAFAAGLLPDPVFGLSQDRPDRGQPGAVSASTRSLSWDVSNLLTLGARQTARRRTDEQVELSLLWAEWQTIADSRLRFARVRSGRTLVARLEAEADSMRGLAPKLRAALERRALTFDVASVGLNAAADVDRQLGEARETLAGREQDLRDLLGLAATEPLPIVGELDLRPIPDEEAEQALAAIPQRRPDLRALELGYAAEEARVRAAILSQFPAVNFGVARSRDNTDISSSGITLSASLPLFDANRGAIRIERATREELHEEYAQRVLAARSEVARLLETQRLLTGREASVAPHAAHLEEAATRAADAYARGGLDWAVYLAIRQSALAAAVELINLHQSLAEARIGLATLLSGDWTRG